MFCGELIDCFTFAVILVCNTAREIFSIVTRMYGVIEDGIWIGNRIYWKLTTRNYSL
jgi:hypothetical protein